MSPLVPPAPLAKELTLDAARETLELHARSTRWLRRDLAKKLDIESFERSGSFHTVFRSFTETRDTARAHVAYRGGPVDGPEHGQPPQPWDIPVAVPGKFIDRDHHEPVPHTDVVKTCHGCNGNGQITCSRCSGGGRVSCSNCGGDGRVNQTRTVTRTNPQGQSETYTESYTESCGTCSGSGRVTCSDCAGSGRITCPTCDGATRVKHYLQLHVGWKTQVSDHVVEKTDLPDDLVTGAIGICIHSEEDDRLEPMIGSGGGRGPYREGGGRVNAEVNEAANRLIQSHRFPGGTKLLRQALVVRAVPVYEARYRWGKEVRRFWVYGTDEQVHAPGYPLSILRIGLAAGIPAGLAGGMVVFGFASSPSNAPPPPPQPAMVATVAPPPAPLPEPTPLPAQTAPVLSATTGTTTGTVSSAKAPPTKSTAPPARSGRRP
jgi:hypothetical protein